MFFLAAAEKKENREFLFEMMLKPQRK